MPNAAVGMQRVLTRLRPTRTTRDIASVRFHRRRPISGADMPVRATSLAGTAEPRAVRAPVRRHPIRRLARSRLGMEALVPLAVVAIVTGASVLSWLPGMPARGAVGGTTSDQAAPRVAWDGGERSWADLRPVHGASGMSRSAPPPGLRRADAARGTPDYRRLDPEAIAAALEADSANPPTLGGPFLADGTLLKPVAVSTTLADGKALLREYVVEDGDSLVTIGRRFGISPMSVAWANGLTSPVLTVGAKLRIPPVSGIVHTVREGDTLDALARRYGIDANRIYETNRLEDPVLIAGQVLVLPGAEGPPFPPPKPAAPVSEDDGTTPARPPTRYEGGQMSWPVVGGDNYVSQHYRAGHFGIDIAADYGAVVRAAAGGTVTFAGWKSNGGGYQVWIAHGSGLFTTYNHLSGVSVGVGQTVGRGQQVGRIGQSGWATGPHLHFEVWQGPIWNGGTRVNPHRYL